jgi:hypothetical protein
MTNTIIELKKLGIDKVVDRMKLSVLANHIVKSMHEMTTGYPHVSSGECSADHTRLDPMTKSLIRRLLFAAHGELAPPSTVRSPCGPARLEPTIFDGSIYTTRVVGQCH